MKKILAFCLSVVASLGVGCKTLSEHSATVQLIVSQAAMRYVEQAVPSERVARAGRVIAAIAAIEARTSGETVTIADLASVALTFIPGDLEPSDRALALSIVNIAAQELSRKLGNGTLPQDGVIQVRGVLQAIRDGVAFYIPRSS